MGFWCKCCNLWISKTSILIWGYNRLMEGKRLKKLAEGVENTELHVSENTTQHRVISSDDLSPLTADLCGILTPRLRGI